MFGPLTRVAVLVSVVLAVASAENTVDRELECEPTISEIELSLGRKPLKSYGRRLVEDSSSEPKFPSNEKIKRLAEDVLVAGSPGGAVVTVVRDGKPSCQAFGFADREQGLSMTCKHAIQIASVTKTFTGLLALIAKKKNAVDLDAPVQQNMPEYTPKPSSGGDTLTLRDMINHRSGLPRHDKMWQFPFSPREGLTRDQLLHSLQFLEHNTPQRTQFTYSNLLFTVGGMATSGGLNRLDQSSVDKEWEDHIKDEIFTPLGMPNSFSSLSQYKAADPKTKQPMPVAYHDDRRGSGPMDLLDGDVVGPAYSVVTCGDDMGKYVENIINEHNGKYNLLDKETVEELKTIQMLTPPSSFGRGGGYSWGWNVVEYHGVSVHYHDGAAYGFSSLVGVVPDYNFGAFIAVNKYHSGRPDTGFKSLVDTLLGIVREEVSTIQIRRLQDSTTLLSEATGAQKDEGGDAVQSFLRANKGRNLQFDESNNKDLSSFVGTFRHPAYGIYSIRLTRNEDGLEYSWGLSKSPEYRPLSALTTSPLAWYPNQQKNKNKFNRGATMYFILDAKGDVMGFLTKLEKGDRYSKKVLMAPIAFLKKEHPFYGNKWYDQKFRSLPTYHPPTETEL